VIAIGAKQMKHVRVKRSEATWRELFSRQAASGVTVAEFCRSEGINAGLFRRWRSVLSRSGRRGARPRKANAVSQGAAPFIDLGGLRSGRSRFEVRLELGAGVVLSVARG
jgi:transposase-like protein